MGHFTEETKKRVVRYHIQDGRTIASLSAEYGASKATISNWIRSYREKCQTNDEAESEYELMQEVRRLHKQLEEAEKENHFLKKSSVILCEVNRLAAYRFIAKHEDEFGIRWMLRSMGICPNAFYNYLEEKKSEYLATKADIHRKIKTIYHETGGILGHRSMRIFLLRKGISLSKATVHQYMNKDLQLLCIYRRKRPEYKKGQPHKIFPNLLKQKFEVTPKNKV